MGDGRSEMGGGRLVPSDLPPPIHVTASRGFELPLARGDSRLRLRLRKETPPG